MLKNNNEKIPLFYFFPCLFICATVHFHLVHCYFSTELDDSINDIKKKKNPEKRNLNLSCLHV